MNRRSIARRRPVVVYRLSYADPPNTSVVVAEAWFAEDDVTGRLDRSRFIGKATLTEYEGPRIPNWLDNRDTDAIHRLHADVRSLIWEFDDAIRSASKR